MDCGSDASIDNVNTFTSWAWMRYEGTPSASDNMYIFSKNGFDKIYLFVKDLAGSNELNGFVDMSTGQTVIVDPNAFNDDEWTFVAGTFDNARPATEKWELFVGTTPNNLALIDNVSVDGSGSIDNDAGGNLIIGGRSIDNNRNYKGQLAGIGLASSVLTITQLRSVMANQAHGASLSVLSVPVLGLDDPEPDWSGNGNTGALTGATKFAGNPPVELLGNYL